MKKIQDKNTRYFVDVDLKTGKILGWDFDQREKLVSEKLAQPFYHRIFITKGQYNKLVEKQSSINDLM